jgi:hypothetical protein
MLHAVQNLLLVASLALIAGGLWMRDRLPGPEAVLPASLPEPTQEPERRAPFPVSAGGVDYTVSPLYRYELRGMVVSRHDTSAWWDVVHRDWWSDHLNVVDLCVVWGETLRSGVHRRMRYASGTFTCYYATDDGEAWQRFRPEEISNNHLLANDPAIVKRLRGVRPGDQIVVRGALAEYGHAQGGFARGTSTRRDDQGNGACETIWVTEARVLKRANAGWRTALPLGVGGLLLALALWFVLPPRPVE